ncbi:MAG: hypothetical protein J5I98_26745 [Phaeodactylibacter sp.]|nr:hypothetical protein [Phaeodactylibacter sp.]
MRQQLLLAAFFAGAANLLSGQAEQNAPELNRALSARIDSLKTEDQKYRNRLTELKNMSIPDEAEIKQAQEAILKTDSLNLIQVKRIFRQYDRRGEMGLSPIAFYIETMNTRYFGSLKKE